MQHVIRGVVVEGDPTNTHTTYSLVYPTGTVTTDVHEAIDRWLNDVHDEICAIYVVLPDPFTQPMWVQLNEVSRVDFEIVIDGTDTMIEQVCYQDETREATVEHHVWVHGFDQVPAVPELVE